MLKGDLFEKYAPVMKTFLSPVSTKLPDGLLMEKQDNLSIYYAPFDWANTKAKVVLVGITPGLQQSQNAINAACEAFKNSASLDDAAKSAKYTGSFSGTMRSSLIDMLNYIGLDKILDINSCEELFGARRDLVHYTSLLRYPVFLKERNYKGVPNMMRHPLLKKHLLNYFARDAELLPDALWIPLGVKVTETLSWLSEQGVIDKNKVLSGLPHPSGENSERIAYFLDRKSKEALSTKTNPDNIDSAKKNILFKISSL